MMRAVAFSFQDACLQGLDRQRFELRRLVDGIGDPRMERRGNSALTRHEGGFRRDLELHRLDLEGDLLPALLDSMAGSDAVCIRHMREGVAADLLAIELKWSALQERLELAETGAGAESVVAQGELLTQAIDRLIVFERTELLPMAERLLSDESLTRIRDALRARRQAKPRS
jgi:hypothetical protein